jgi:hypothetical protein
LNPSACFSTLSHIFDNKMFKLFEQMDGTQRLGRRLQATASRVAGWQVLRQRQPTKRDASDVIRQAGRVLAEVNKNDLPKNNLQKIGGGHNKI